MSVLIDIPRAIAQERKITFSHANNWRLYYDTVFGEQFSIPIWKIQSGDIPRIAKAADWVSHMVYHNDQVQGGSN